MSRPSSTPLAAFRDILVAVTEEGRGDEAEAALGYGLSLAATAGAHLTVQSAARRLTMVAGAGLGSSTTSSRARTGACVPSRGR